MGRRGRRRPRHRAGARLLPRGDAAPPARDTSLEVDGPLAAEWMANAQAFAGPADGDGSEPRGRDAGSELVDELEALAVARSLAAVRTRPGGRAPGGGTARARRRSRRRRCAIVDRNWLAWATSAAELGVDEAGHVLDVVGLVGLPQQQRRRAATARPPARGRSAGRGRRRCRRRRGIRRCGGRGAAGSAATGRGRARRRAAACGSSTPPATAGAAPLSSSPSDHAEEHDLAGRPRAPGRRSLLVLAAWRRARRRRRRDPTSPSNRRCRRGGAPRVPPPPTWPACRRNRTRRRRGGRRWRAPLGTGRFIARAGQQVVGLGASSRGSRDRRGRRRPSANRGRRRRPARPGRAVGLGAVAGERARAVGEPEAADPLGTHDDVGAVVAAVGHEA